MTTSSACEPLYTAVPPNPRAPLARYGAREDVFKSGRGWRRTVVLSGSEIPSVVMSRDENWSHRPW
jgi:hypothetical protein